ACLYRKALHAVLGQWLAGQRVLHPVHDAQRQRVRFPATALSWWIFQQPVGKQAAVPATTLCCITGVEVVEVVLVVALQFVCPGPVPAQVAEAAAYRQEVEGIGGEQARFTGDRGYPATRVRVRVRGRGEVGAGTGTAKPHAPEHLSGPKMAQGVPVQADA